MANATWKSMGTAAVKSVFNELEFDITEYCNARDRGWIRDRVD